MAGAAGKKKRVWPVRLLAMTNAQRARRLVGLWLFAIAIGMAGLWSYATGPGVGARAPSHWPHSSTLSLHPKRLTVVMFAHPKCPCTRASIGELHRLATRCGDALAISVVFWQPASSSVDWTRGALRQATLRIPGVDVRPDQGGVEAERFGVATSGQVVVYGPDGRRSFRGGITGGRGHAGDSFGGSAIIDLATNGSTSRRTTPVYGCPLRDPEEKR